MSEMFVDVFTRRITEHAKHLSSPDAWVTDADGNLRCPVDEVIVVPSPGWLTRPARPTLRDRLHEFFHVGAPEIWACRNGADPCPLIATAVDPMAALISEWLDEQGLVMTAKGTVLTPEDFDELAAEAEAGFEVVDGKLVPIRPAQLPADPRRRPVT